MLYIYDKAIAEDLSRSFTPYGQASPSVKVVDPEAAIGIAAQLQDDKVSFPLVVLNRNPDTPIDSTRMNFTRLHAGVPTVFDEKTNELYHEKVVPIDLKYAITVLATNVADLDEMVRELIFKYTDMYFLTVTVPYESKRKIRFGVVIDSEIERSSGVAEHINQGRLFQAIIPLKCEGAVLVNYTPVKLRRLEERIVVDTVK